MSLVEPLRSMMLKYKEYVFSPMEGLVVLGAGPACRYIDMSHTSIHHGLEP